MNKSQLQTIQKKIISQVEREYTSWYNHIRQEIQRKEKILQKYMNPIIPKGQVRVELLHQNIQLEKAMFLTDEIWVKFLSDEWVLWNEMMRNAELVAKYDDVDMCLREQREKIIDYNALYGLAVTVVDWYDEIENQPISDVINPLHCIIDPSNYTGSKMRFFGIRRILSKDYLSDNWFMIDESDYIKSSEYTETKRKEAMANNLTYIEEWDDWLCEVYDHFTIFDGKKWLTSWNADRSKLIKVVEIEPLTSYEKKKPSKTKWNIQLHRRKPKFGSVFWISIADEVMKWQDAISVLTNLQLKQANIIANGNDVFADSRLWLKTQDLAQTMPWWRIISYEWVYGLDVRQAIYEKPASQVSPFIQEMIASLENRAEQTTWISKQSLWVSQSGQQTKAEVQTLQQNANQLFVSVADNYLQWQKEYWESHYRAYCLYFPERGKKWLSLYQKWSAVSKELKREDFIADGKVNVYITSRSQDSIENEKEFNKLTILSQFYLTNMKPWHSMNEFLREIWRKTNIRDFRPEKYITETVDEMNANKNVSLINKNIEVPWPQVWEDYLTYILIYQQCLETEMKARILPLYEQAYQELQQQTQAPETWQWSWTVANIAMNNLNQQAQTSPTSLTM